MTPVKHVSGALQNFSNILEWAEEGGDLSLERSEDNNPDVILATSDMLQILHAYVRFPIKS